MTQRRVAWRADHLLAAEFPEPRWAVPGVVAEGISLLVGPPKIGKSWLALNVSLAVALGGRALGRVKVDEGDVLYLALEDTARRLQRRLRTALGTDPAPSRLVFITDAPTLNNGGAEQIEQWMSGAPEPRLLVVDVFAKLRGRPPEYTDRYSADYAALTTLKKIADDKSLAVLVLHHTRKADADDFVDTVSGTHGLAGAADTVIALSRSRNTSQAVLQITGRDVEETKHQLEFDSTIGTWTLLEGSADDYQLTEERRQILAALRDSEGLTPKQIADKTGLPADSVRHVVRTMVKQQQLDTDGQGHYLTPSQPSPPSLINEHSEWSEGDIGALT